MGDNREIRLEEVPIDQGQKRKALQTIAKAVDGKRYAYCPSGWEIFRGQLKYISRFCLGGQMAGLLLMAVLFGYFQWKGEDVEVYLGAASAAASCMGVFLMLELNRSNAIGMLELEQTCYLNFKQVWCVKMVLFGCLDILSLTVLTVVVAGNVSYGIVRVAVYLLAPFVVSNMAQLLVFSLLRGRGKEYLQAAAAAACGMASLIPACNPRCYAMAGFGVWVAALLAGIVCLAGEIGFVCHKIEEGEVFCWN